MEQILLLYEEDYKKIKEVLQQLKDECKSDLTFLADQSGQVISYIGTFPNIDLPTLASLTAGTISANVRIGELLGGEKFISLVTEGHKLNLQVNLIRERFILAVIFDKSTPLGLIRLKMSKSGRLLDQIFAEILEKINEDKKTFGELESPFPEITEDDIDKLFGDD
jgi:predicted regulator of Ras-like GTPase activity (Roadblock/LC7/MglB family)